MVDPQHLRYHYHHDSHMRKRLTALLEQPETELVYAHFQINKLAFF